MAKEEAPNVMTNKENKDIYKFQNKDGTFVRQVSSFRSWISSEPEAQFPPEKGRYVSAIKLPGATCITNSKIGFVYKSWMSMGFED